ncbi:MAG: sugar phosphate isomerase/epimerase [bacterium]
MYPGISTQVFGGRRLSAEHASAIRESGFEAAEIYGMAPHFDLMDSKLVEDAADFFSEAGVRASAVHAPYKALDQRKGRNRRLSPASADPDVIALTMEYVNAAIRAAKRFGAPAVILHCGLYGDIMNGSTVSNLVSFFTMLEDTLAGSGLKIALENVATPVSEPSFLSRLLDKYNFEHFGICLDIAHANIGGDPAETVRNTGRLLQIHVSDNNGKEDRHAIPFDGEIDWAPVMRALREKEYGGCFNFEPRGPETPDVMLSRCRTVYERLIVMR